MEKTILSTINNTISKMLKDSGINVNSVKTSSKSGVIECEVKYDKKTLTNIIIESNEDYLKDHTQEYCKSTFEHIKKTLSSCPCPFQNK